MVFIGAIFGYNLTADISKSVTETVNELRNNADIKSKLQSYSEQSSIASVTFENAKGAVINCKEIINQADAQNTLKENINVIVEDNTQFENQLLNDLTKNIKNDTEQKNEGGFFGPIADTNMGITMTDELTKTINSTVNDISKAIETDLKKKQEAGGDVKFINKGQIKCDNLKNQANALNDVVSDIATTMISDTLSENKVVNKISTTLENSHKQTNEGTNIWAIVAVCAAVSLVGAGGVGYKKSNESAGESCIWSTFAIIFLVIGLILSGVLGIGIWQEWFETGACKYTKSDFPDMDADDKKKMNDVGVFNHKYCSDLKKNNPDEYKELYTENVNKDGEDEPLICETCLKEDATLCDSEDCQYKFRIQGTLLYLIIAITVLIGLALLSFGVSFVACGGSAPTRYNYGNIQAQYGGAIKSATKIINKQISNKMVLNIVILLVLIYIVIN